LLGLGLIGHALLFGQFLLPVSLFLLLGQPRLLLGLFHALALGQVDLLLAALGFLLLPGLLLRDRQRTDALLVDRIRLGDALLRVVLLRCQRILRTRLGKRLRRGDGIFRHRLGRYLFHRLGQVRQFLRGL